MCVEAHTDAAGISTTLLVLHVTLALHEMKFC